MMNCFFRAVLPSDMALSNFTPQIFSLSPKMSRMCPVKAIKKPKILIFNILGFVVPLGLEPRTP